MLQLEETKMAKVTITSGNSKMGAVYNISMPVRTTCRANVPCLKGCYGLKGFYAFQNVKDCYISNLKAYTEDSEDFKMQILHQLY